MGDLHSDVFADTNDMLVPSVALEVEELLGELGKVWRPDVERSARTAV